MQKLKTIVSFFIETYQKWLDDRAMRMAAALAYYGLFSLAPLILVISGLIGAIVERFLSELKIADELGQVDVYGELGMTLERLLGPDVTALVLQMVEGTAESSTVSSSLPLISLISVGLMLWAASSMFKYLHEALNTMWGLKPVVKGGILVTIRRYVVSFVIVFLAGFLLILYLLLNVIVSVLLPVITRFVPEALDILPDYRIIQLVQFGLLFVVATLLFGAIFKILPDVDMKWRDVLIGAAFTALLFGVGVLILGIYFTFYTSTLFGAAGSLIVLLLWFYYSAQIFLFGAEFTYMYSTRYGSQIRPAGYVQTSEDETPEDESAEQAAPSGVS